VATMGGNGGNNSNWYVPNEGYNQPYSHAMGAGGGLYTRNAIQYHNQLDARRSTTLRDGAYPDGYLGFQSGDRRQDKLLEALGNQLNKRPYQRGVHKGAKIASQDYFWPTDFKPDMRLKAEAKYVSSHHDGVVTMDVRRPVYRGSPIERLAHQGKLTGAAGAPQQQQEARYYNVNPGTNPVVLTDPDAQARKFKYLPSYAI
jgi:hypothetical protein